VSLIDLAHAARAEWGEDLESSDDLNASGQRHDGYGTCRAGEESAAFDCDTMMQPCTIVERNRSGVFMSPALKPGAVAMALAN
jgi:hypothetical protein